MDRAAKKFANALGRIRIWRMGPGGIIIDINSGDPDTPAMVWASIKRRQSATYYCAVETGHLDDGNETVVLSERQITWLLSFENMVDEAFNVARRNLPQYA